MKKKVVLVTGSSGFIGRNLTEELLRHKCRVIAFDRVIPEYVAEHDSELLQVMGDIHDQELICRILKKYAVDYVIHLAAISTIQMGALSKKETCYVNVEGTKSLLEAAQNYGKLRGFIYASSDKVYGKLKKKAYLETDELLPVCSFYDQSKAQADYMVRKWVEKYGLHGIVLRFCNIYGEYDRQDTRIVPGSIRACLENRMCTLKVYRNSEGQVKNYRRDLLYVGDLCEGIWKIIEKLEYWNQPGHEREAAWGEAFNLGSGKSCPMEELIRKICQLTESSLPVKIIESTGLLEEIPEQCMNAEKAYRYFGFAPKTSLEEGLQKTVLWWKGERYGK